MANRLSTLALALVLALPTEASSQQPPDSLRAAALGAEAGLADGRSASVSTVRWTSVAATFFLTPFVGGVGSLLAAEVVSGVPSTVPRVGPDSGDPRYQVAYQAAYQSVYRPRYRRAARKAVLFTTIVFFAAATALGG